MIKTDAAPINDTIPDIIIMFGIYLFNNGYKTKEATEATTCGKHIHELNNPIYTPIFEPLKAFVKIVNGIALIVTQTIPIHMKAMIDPNLV